MDVSHENTESSTPSGAVPKLGPEPPRPGDHGIQNVTPTHMSMSGSGCGTDEDDLGIDSDQRSDEPADPTVNCSEAILNGDVKLRPSHEAQEAYAGWTAQSGWTTKHVHQCFRPDPDVVPDQLITEVDVDDTEADEEDCFEVVSDVEDEARPEHDGEMSHYVAGQSHFDVTAVSSMLLCAWIAINRPQLTADCMLAVPWLHIRHQLCGCARTLHMCSAALVEIAWTALIGIVDDVAIDSLSQLRVMDAIEGLQAQLRGFDFANCTTMAYEAAYYLDGTLVALYDALKKNAVVIPRLYRITVHVEYRALKLMLSCLSSYPTANVRHQSSTNAAFTADLTLSG